MRKCIILIIVLLLFPSVLVINQSCGDYDTHISKISIFNPIATIFDLIFEFGNYGKQFDGFNKWYLDYYLLVEIYSLILVLFTYFLLYKKKFIEMRKKFNYMLKILYMKIEFWIFIFGFYFFYSLFFERDTNSTTNIEFSLKNNSTLLLYIFLYISFLILLKLNIEKFEKQVKSLLVFLLILFFPVITLSNSFTNIRPCSDTQDWKYNEVTIIAPFIYGLPKTLSSFLDVDNEKFNFQMLIKIYSIFKILLILYILPSLIDLILRKKNTSANSGLAQLGF